MIPGSRRFGQEYTPPWRPADVAGPCPKERCAAVHGKCSSLGPKRQVACLTDDMHLKHHTRLAQGSFTSQQADAFAEAADISRPTLDRYLAGFPVQPRTIRRIERALAAQASK